MIVGCSGKVLPKEVNNLLSKIKVSNLPRAPREPLLADALVQVGRVHAVFGLLVALVIPVQALIFRRTGEKVPLRRTAATLDEIRLLQKGTRRACRGVAPPAAGMGGALGAEPAAAFAVQRAPSATYPSLGQTPTTRLKGRAAGDSSFIIIVNDHFIRQTLPFWTLIWSESARRHFWMPRNASLTFQPYM